MKKTMKMPVLVACLFFLISGFSSLEAQTALWTTANPGGTEILQENPDALVTLKTELHSNYPAVLPPANNVSNATTVLMHKYLELTYQYMDRDGKSVSLAINQAFSDTYILGEDSWPGLVTESWKLNVIDLLSK